MNAIVAATSSATVFSVIETEQVGKVGVIRLNRPKKRNAINGVMMQEVTAALSQFAKNDVIGAIVLCANGPSFSAGFDLKELAEQGISSAQEWGQVLREDFDFVMQFWDCPKPTIAAIHGFCIGGGLELAVACDFTIADENTLMGEPEMKFGSSIAAMIVPWLIGAKFAKEMLLCGDDRITAQRAYELGLINQVCHNSSYFERALELATQLAAYSAVSVQMTKKAINRSYDMSGMREALLAAIDTATLIEANTRPENAEFEHLRKTQGMQAALAWRNSQLATASS